MNTGTHHEAAFSAGLGHLRCTLRRLADRKSVRNRALTYSGPHCQGPHSASYFQHQSTLQAALTRMQDGIMESLHGWVPDSRRMGHEMVTKNRATMVATSAV